MLAEAVELFVVLKVNDDLAAAAGGGADFDFRAQRVSEFLLQGRNLIASGSFVLAGAGQDVGFVGVFVADLLADDPFHVANAEAVAFDPFGKGDLFVLVA
jgi:hypothetical protein